MKNNLLALTVVGACLASCATEHQDMEPVATSSARIAGPLTGKFNVSSLSKLVKLGVSSSLNVMLYTPDGKLVEQTSDLQPNTTYRIAIEGVEDVQIRACFGFALLGDDQQAKQENSFLIKTSDDVLEPLIVSVIPLRHIGKSTYREQAQTIALTR